MTKPSHIARWLRYTCAALMLAFAASGAAVPGLAQQAAPEVPAASQVDVVPPGEVRIPAPRDPKNLDPTTNGLTLIHGNYCGVGSRPGGPIDALDVACMHHDACTPTGGLPTCGCNARLREEAAAVSRDPRQPVELQSLASMVAAAATVMLCKPTLNVAAPAAATPPPVPPAAIPSQPTSIVPADAAPAPVDAAPIDITPKPPSQP